MPTLITAALRPHFVSKTAMPILLSRTDGELIGTGRRARAMKILPGKEDTVPLPPSVTVEQLADPVPIESFGIDDEMAPGVVLGVPNLDAIPAPGHCEGQRALLWSRHGGVLLCGDAVANFEAVDIGLDQRLPRRRTPRSPRTRD